MFSQTPARPHNFDVEFFVEGLDKDVQKFHYYVTEVDKPKFDFNYEEVNQYGFRYNILTGLRFGEVNMTILDDSDNRSISFLYAYLNDAVYGLEHENFGGLSSTKTTRFNNSKILPTLEADPAYANVVAQGGTSGRGVVIQEIRVHQYVSVGWDGSAKGRIRTWSFQDPQITNIDMQAFAVDAEEMGTFALSFNFKNVSMKLDTEDYPDTPFDLLRASIYADSLEGLATTPPSGIIKGVAKGGVALATSKFNKDVGGLSPGGASGIIVPSKKGGSTAPITPEIASEKNKNGYVAAPPSPPISENITKTVPNPEAQASKLAKL